MYRYVQYFLFAPEAYGDKRRAAQAQEGRFESLIVRTKLISNVCASFL